MSVQNHTPLRLRQSADPQSKPLDDQSLSNGRPKEAEPLARSAESVDLAEVREVVEHEPQDEEVKQFVEVKKETPDIPLDVKQAGVQASGTTQFPSYQSIALPLSDDKILVGQNAPITSSLRWLSTLAQFILSQAHLTIKLVHGKATRVFKK